MIRTQVYLPDKVNTELKMLARAEGVNYSSLVREGVVLIIEQKKTGWVAPLAGLVGKSKGGPKNVASNVNLLYK